MLRWPGGEGTSAGQDERSRHMCFTTRSGERAQTLWVCPVLVSVRLILACCNCTGIWGEATQLRITLDVDGISAAMSHKTDVNPVRKLNLLLFCRYSVRFSDISPSLWYPKKRRIKTLPTCFVVHGVRQPQRVGGTLADVRRAGACRDRRYMVTKAELAESLGEAAAGGSGIKVYKEFGDVAIGLD